MYRVAHPGLSRKPPSEPRRVHPSLKQSSELRIIKAAAEASLISFNALQCTPQGIHLQVRPFSSSIKSHSLAFP